MTSPRLRSFSRFVSLLLLPSGLCLSAPPLSPGPPSRLRCETLASPLGLDEPHPRLSWRVTDPRRGARQTAYQVRVATSPERLAGGKADLWDSGKVVSDRSVEVEYAGRPLRSRVRCYWSVRTWDGSGKPSAFSAPAVWEMGLMLNTGVRAQSSRRPLWRARWIGLRAKGGEEFDLKPLSWVWHDGDANALPNSARYFRRAVTIPKGAIITRARFLLGADNWFALFVNGKEVGQGSGWNPPAVLDIAPHLRPGENVLGIVARNEDGPAGLMGQLLLEYRPDTARLSAALLETSGFKPGERAAFAASSATVLRIAVDQSWKGSDQSGEGWLTSAFDERGWKAARPLAQVGESPWGRVPTPGTAHLRAPLLRKGFTLRKPVRSARIYATALGSYQLTLNGTRVGNEILAPGWTDYRKRIPYQTFDVTPLLRPGTNALGAMLGDGWYASGLGWELRRNSFGPPPTRLLAQLEVIYKDGTREIIPTDVSWKAIPGPILRSELYAGETYDARLEPEGWRRPGFDDHRWGRADVLPDTTARLEGQDFPPIRISRTLKPVKVSRPAPGVYVFDMGQNMVGWARLRVKGPKGTAVRLRFAEILKPDGHLYRDNLRKAEATDTYTLRGGGEEVWEPRFTYHGFRYVEVTGYPGAPGLNAIEGRVFHTDGPTAGTLVTSSPMVNRLQQNIVWGQRGNLMSVPTDCPQRDERLGWMGDAQIFARTSVFNMDLQAFYTKWMRDLVDAQSPRGGFSDVSPRIIDEADGAPAWGDAGIVIPWTVYQAYGDTRILRRNYAAMAKWIGYIHSANPDLVWRNRRNNDFGDWVPAGSDTPKDVIATAYFAYDAALMAKMAATIGRTDDSRRYAELAEGIRAAFNREFVTPDGKIKGETQTCYAMALHMGLLPVKLRARAARHLVDDIEKRGGHLSTGFIGTAYLMNVLSETGHTDTAYRLLEQTTYPSWGYMISKGATTIWERWNGDTGDPGMNSFNHFAFGAVGDWMAQYLGGIGLDPDVPGYKHIRLHPRPGGSLRHAKATYENAYGTILSEWKKEGTGITFNFVVPANTRATVTLPFFPKGKVTESGKPLNRAPGVRVAGKADGEIVLTVGAGAYHFRSE